MLKAYPLIDLNGLFIEDVLYDDAQEIPESIERAGVTYRVIQNNPVGFNKPKLVDGEWVEGNEFDLDAYKAKNIDLISDLRDAELTAGFLSTITIESVPTDVEFDYSSLSQTRLTKQSTLISIDPSIDEIQWSTKNAGFLVLSREQFIQVLKDAANHEITIEFKYLYAKAYILNAVDKDGVDLIVSGW